MFKIKTQGENFDSLLEWLDPDRKGTRVSMRLLRQLLSTSVTIVLSAFAANVYACQCREREPPCAQYASANVVFIGSVVRKTSSEQSPREKIDFSIERSLKGLSGITTELVNYGTSCDYAFKEGKTYLVYAYRNSARNELYTDYCTRTTELSNASSDLAFFSLPAEKRQPSQILGVLADNDKRLREVSIVASSAGRSYRTTTDNDGWFSIKVPQPSKYRVRIFLPLYADVVGSQAELNKIRRG